MRFLIEKLLITTEEQNRYATLSDKKKTKFIMDFVDKQPNAKYLKPILTSTINVINKYGFDTATNKYLEFLTNLNFYIDQEPLNLIFELIGNEKLKPTDKWLFNQSLYTESTENILQKIKIVTFANDRKNIEKYKVKFDPIFLMKANGKDFLDLAGMNRKIDEWQARIDIKEKETKKEKERKLRDKEAREKELYSKREDSDKVKDYLKTIIKPYNAPNIRKFIMDNTEFKSEQPVINKFVEEGLLDDDIEKILNMSLKSSMGKPKEEVLMSLLSRYIYDGYRKQLAK